MRTKEKITQRERGGCEEDHLRFAKTRSKKETEKDGKTLRTTAARTFLATTPNPRKKKLHGRAPTARQICARSGQTAKNALFKMSSVLQPQGFFTLGPQFDKNWNIEPYKIVTRRKNYPQDGSAKSSLFDTPKRLEEVERREIAPKPLFCSVSRVSTSTPVLPGDRRPESRKRGLKEGWSKKNVQKASKMALLRKGRFRYFLIIVDFPRKPGTPFRTIKQVVSEDPARLLTHKTRKSGPLSNPLIYIYSYRERGGERCLR